MNDGITSDLDHSDRGAIVLSSLEGDDLGPTSEPYQPTYEFLSQPGERLQ